MKEIKIFNKKEFGEIRTTVINNEPYLMLNDVCKILDLNNVSQVKTRLKKDGVISNEVGVQTGIKKDGTPAIQKVKATFVDESNLYKVIFQSRKPEAEKFTDWVTSEVLPSIRKHGAYMTDKTLDEIADDPELLIKLATNLKEERNKRKELEVENEKKNQIIGELKPRADYTDTILQNKGLVTITQIAKDYGMSGQAMNGLLHGLKVQYKQSEQWLLYAEHHGKGYTHSETIPIVKSNGHKDIKMNTKWTQKGRLFLYELLKENEILPLIERSV